MKIRLDLRALAALCLGLSLALTQAQRHEQLRLPAGAEQRIIAEVDIEYVEPPQARRQQFIGSVGDRRVALSWSAGPPLQAGDRWRLLMDLQPPRRPVNPGAPDAPLAELAAGIHAAGHIVDSPLNGPLEVRRLRVNRLRGALARSIDAAIPERDAAALAIALTVGDTARLSVEQWRVFGATGITHLIAISGLHVTLFCLVLAALSRRVWRICPRLQVRFRRDSFAAAIGMLAAGAYAGVAGFGVPAVRTLLMLVAWQGVRLCARPVTVAPPLAVALALVLLGDPLAPLGAGFWLSFAAVAALLLDGGATPGRWISVRALLRAQAVVAAALLALCIAEYGRVSLAGLLVNLLAIPLFSGMLVPLVLMATAVAALWPAAAAVAFSPYLGLHALAWPALRWIADQPLAMMQFEPSFWWYSLAAVAAVLALLRLPGVVRATACLLLVPLCWPASGPADPPEFTVTVFDAGRAQAVLVRTARHALLFDTGDSWGSRGAFARSTLVPALRHYRLEALDRLYVPRPDNDHVAGTLWLGTQMPLRQLLAPPAAAPPEYAHCATQDRWQWDGVRFDTLDAAHCVLRIASRHGVMLLAGDADRVTLAALSAAGKARADAVLVARGGAASGHAPQFVTAAAARIAVISQSARGAAARTVQQSRADWCAAGAVVWLTGEQGALQITADRQGLRWGPAATDP